MRLYLFILAANCLATPAMAQPDDNDRRRESIPVAEVRMNDPQAVAALQRKIDRAVRRVCAFDEPRNVISRDVRNCRKEARRDADRQLAHMTRQIRMAANEPR